jgi:hypothetical protein
MQNDRLLELWRLGTNFRRTKWSWFKLIAKVQRTIGHNGSFWRKADGHAHIRSRRQNGHASPEGSGLGLAKADTLSSITARTQTRPIYHRDARGTIRLRVASWEDNRHELFGRKGPDDMASSLTSNPLHRREP